MKFPNLHKMSYSLTKTFSTVVVVVIAFMLMTAGHFANAAPHVAADLVKVDVNDGFADLVAAVKPAVVNISTTSSTTDNRRFGNRPPELDEFFRKFFGEPPDGDGAQPRTRKTTAVGSGFIIAEDGLVVTNHHVIDGADEIEVVFDDGTRVPATLKGEDKKTDLALLQINVGRPLPYLAFGDSDEARVGDWVVAIGNPFGLGGTTTSGIISARGRDIQAGPLDDFIQIDAPINRGNSGGPLFNTKGEVIGVNSAIYSPTGGSVGIGFAIPSSMASNVIAQLRDGGVVRRGFLGVYLQTVSEEISESLGLEKATGALVTEVFADSPAEAAGIQAGDVILVYDGEAVNKMRDLPKLVARTKKETEVDIEIWRGDERKTLRVAIGGSDAVADNDSDASDAGDLGISVATLDAEAREKYDIAKDANGVVIVGVDGDGAAAGRGLRVGDLIQRVNQRAVNSPQELTDAVQAVRDDGKQSVLLLVERDGQSRFVAVPIES